MQEQDQDAKAKPATFGSSDQLSDHAPNQQFPVKSSSISGISSGSKVNQAAFIHKLYSMLEDDSIKHLISWTPSNDSFVISPGEEFSKVLSQYFKHTNPSSFVRQLNMYGFHKVNDTFHGSNSSSSLLPSATASSESSSQWEFKHGAGSFKRGDVDALRAIKRRASRPSSVHRDNISLKSVSLSVPSTPPADYGTTPPPQGPSLGATPVVGPPSALPLQQPGQHHPGPQHTQNYLPQHHTVPYYPPPDNSIEARMASFEHSLWTLRSSHSILLSKYNNLVDYCRRSHADQIHVVDSLSKLVPLLDPSVPKVKSEGEITPSSISFELNHIRNNLHAHTNALAQLTVDDHPPYLTQYPPGAPGAPVPTHSGAASPAYSYSFSQYHHPGTKSEISFGSSARDRAGSVLYDPLAPAPNPSSPRQHIEDNTKLIPTSVPQGVHLHRASTSGLSQTSQRASPANSTPSSPTFRPSEHVGYAHPPASPQHPAGPTSVPHFNPEPPASPGHLLQSHILPPTRDQRPGSFPFVSSYHTQRQQAYAGGPLIPSSNPYGTPPTGTAPGGINKLRAEAMVPYRRHTSSELLCNPSAPSASSAMSHISAAISMTTPPDSSSRHNSCASSNSSSSGSGALTFTATSNLSSTVTNANSTPPAAFQPTPASKPSTQTAPALTVDPPSSESNNSSPQLSKENVLPPLNRGSSVQSLLNPTTSTPTESEEGKKDTDHAPSPSDIEPERKRLKVV